MFRMVKFEKGQGPDLASHSSFFFIFTIFFILRHSYYELLSFSNSQGWIPGFGQVLLSIAIQVTLILYSLPVLSDPLGIITSAYFFVCKIGIIVRWVYSCELMLLNFHAKDKCSIPMGEVLYIVSAIPTNRFAQSNYPDSIIS